MRSLLLILTLSVVGCASPAEDYIRADAAAWRRYDQPGPDGRPLIDEWVDAEPTLSPGVKTALHQLNDGRRARIAHAVAEIGTGS